MHRVRVFLNSKASSSQSNDWRGQIEEGLFRSQLEFVDAPSLEVFKQELRKATEDQVDAVISVGGDGTFNTLLQELAGGKTPFLVVPAGTANDLARELGVTPRLRKAIEAIRKNEVHSIDLISVNGTYMATNGGIGLVSEVADQINAIRNRFPRFKSVMSSLSHHTYSLGLASHLMTGQYRYHRVKIESESFSGEIETPLLLVSNQPCIAGSFPIAPNTRNDDGHFNVTAFLHRRWKDFVGAVLKVKKGQSIAMDPEVISFETSELTLESISLKHGQLAPLSFFGDGEDLAFGTKLHFTILHQALSVFRPYCHPSQSEPKQSEISPL